MTEEALVGCLRQMQGCDAEDVRNVMAAWFGPAIAGEWFGTIFAQGGQRVLYLKQGAPTSERRHATGN